MNNKVATRSSVLDLAHGVTTRSFILMLVFNLWLTSVTLTYELFLWYKNSLYVSKSFLQYWVVLTVFVWMQCKHWEIFTGKVTHCATNS